MLVTLIVCPGIVSISQKGSDQKITFTQREGTYLTWRYSYLTPLETDTSNIVYLSSSEISPQESSKYYISPSGTEGASPPWKNDFVGLVGKCTP